MSLLSYFQAKAKPKAQSSQDDQPDSNRINAPKIISKDQKHIQSSQSPLNSPTRNRPTALPSVPVTPTKVTKKTPKPSLAPTSLSQEDPDVQMVVRGVPFARVLIFFFCN
jgi:hypothetical protein